MPLWLGINEDLFDSGVSLTDGEQVLFASNEERYTRRKNEGGFPRLSLDALFAYTRVDPNDIDYVCFSGLMTPPLPVRGLPFTHNWLFEARRSHKESFLRGFFDDVTFYLPFLHTSEDSLLRRCVVPFLRPVARMNLGSPLKNKQLFFIDHHISHAAGAWRLSGMSEALCVTVDGMGDGLSMTISRCEEGREMERLWTASSRDSFGLFFQVLAEALGFLSCRDEGKMTGLAAAGDASKVDYPCPFTYENGRLRFSGRLGQRGIEQARKDLASRYSREDLSAWSQDILESFVAKIVREWLRKTGLRNLIVSGGCAANVKMNQRLHQIEEVDSLFVLPNMSDAGLSLGAVCASGGLKTQKVKNVFWGEDYVERDIAEALARRGLTGEPRDDVDECVGRLLAEGKIVGRFTGRMEWGPRALGNRSILVRTTDRAVVDRLNGLLRRSDFMPFAPAVLDEDADEHVMNAGAARHAAEFMTVCFDCAPKMKQEHPAVVHLDGTARAQLVRAESNPAFHRVLTSFKKHSGQSVVLNTSFNIHEEPIIRTPDEAVAAFLNARLDYLAIGDFVVKQPSDA
jgi:carbamoyltransferase